ncbi:MAG: OB-fold nucleic acid binding domain-containing protein, partial [Eubacteriales bacterium]
MNLIPFNKAGGVEGFCIIKALEKKTTAKGLPFLDLILADSSGEIVAKFWDYKEELQGKFETGQLVKARGTVSIYNDVDQLRVERLRPVIEADGVSIGDFVPSSEYSGESMLAEISAVIGAFKEKELKDLVTAVVNEYKEKFLYWPAAFKLHHAIRGGLLYHTLSILRLAQGLSKVYPFVD